MSSLFHSLRVHLHLVKRVDAGLPHCKDMLAHRCPRSLQRALLASGVVYAMSSSHWRPGSRDQKSYSQFGSRELSILACGVLARAAREDTSDASATLAESDACPGA